MLKNNFLVFILFCLVFHGKSETKERPNWFLNTVEKNSLGCLFQDEKKITTFAKFYLYTLKLHC